MSSAFTDELLLMNSNLEIDACNTFKKVGTEACLPLGNINFSFNYTL